MRRPGRGLWLAAALLLGAGPRGAAQESPGALLDRLTHRVHILEANGESHRLRDAKKRLRRA